MSRVMLKSLLYTIALLICIASLYYFYNMVVARHYLGYYDLSLFTRAAERAWQNKELYVRGDNLPYLYSPGAPVFKFPPPYLFMFMPWVSNGIPVNFPIAFCIVMTVIFLLTSILSCYSLLAPFRAHCQKTHTTTPEFRTGLFIVLCVFITAIFFPFLESIGGICAENFIPLLLLLGLLLMRRYPFVAGMIISYTAWMKIYPAFILVYIIAKRQWTVLYGWLFGFAATFLLSLSVFGIKESTYYFGTVLPVLLQEKIDEHWHNVNVIHWFWSQNLISPLNGPAFTILRVIVILPLLYVLLSRRPPAFWRDAAEYAWVIVAMMICLPNMWSSYYVILLFPVLVMTGILVLHGMWIRLFFFSWITFCLVANEVWLWKVAEVCCNMKPDMPIPVEIKHDTDQYGVLGIARHSVPAMLLMLGQYIQPMMPAALWLAFAAWLLPRRADNVLTTTPES